MVAIYLAKRYGSSVRWAIAGRRRDALEAVRAECLTLNKDFTNVSGNYNDSAAIPIIIADSADLQSLHAMTRQAVCVLTTAGPFDKYGSLLVQSCAQQGTHYCDITGETDWVRRMIDLHDDTARRSGARVVSFCGHDCIPWDLLVLMLSSHLLKRGGAITTSGSKDTAIKNKKRTSTATSSSASGDGNNNSSSSGGGGETLVSVSFYDEILAGPSGGTMDTVFHSLGGARKQYVSLLGFDPLLKTAAAGTAAGAAVASGNRVEARTQRWLGYSAEHEGGAWVGPFVMAMVMCNCVRRSNALNNYSARLVYKEAAVYPSFMAGYVGVLLLLVLGTVLMCPPLSWAMRRWVLPAPGQGPSEREMDSGFLRVTGYAVGSSGTKVNASLYFPTDPGYRDTAR